MNTTPTTPPPIPDPPVTPGSYSPSLSGAVLIRTIERLLDQLDGQDDAIANLSSALMSGSSAFSVSSSGLTPRPARVVGEIPSMAQLEGAPWVPIPTACPQLRIVDWKKAMLPGPPDGCSWVCVELQLNGAYTITTPFFLIQTYVIPKAPAA